MINLDRVRADTPAATRRAYLHNAGAAGGPPRHSRRYASRSRRAPSAIVSFTVEGREAQAVAASAGRAGTTIGISDPSSTRLDAEARSLLPLVRASPHYYNTEADVDRLIEHCAGLRSR